MIGIKGEPDDGVQSDHMMECPVCGLTFDMRDLFDCGLYDNERA
jgi:hypothetical protein